MTLKTYDHTWVSESRLFAVCSAPTSRISRMTSVMFYFTDGVTRPTGTMIIIMSINGKSVTWDEDLIPLLECLKRCTKSMERKYPNKILENIGGDDIELIGALWILKSIFPNVGRLETRASMEEDGLMLTIGFTQLPQQPPSLLHKYADYIVQCITATRRGTVRLR